MTRPTEAITIYALLVGGTGQTVVNTQDVSQGIDGGIRRLNETAILATREWTRDNMGAQAVPCIDEALLRQRNQFLRFSYAIRYAAQGQRFR